MTSKLEWEIIERFCRGEPLTDAEAEIIKAKHDAASDALEERIDGVLERLEHRYGGRLPNVSIPELIDWTTAQYGEADHDVSELRRLEEEYDYLRVNRLRR